MVDGQAEIMSVTGSMLRVTPYYAVALALLFLLLSVRVIIARRTRNVGFGSGSDPDLERRIRVHANFAEYTPFALILLVMAELRGAPAPYLHGLCMLLVLGRVAHAVGVSNPRSDGIGRILGMAGSQTTILGAAVLLVLNPS